MLAIIDDLSEVETLDDVLAENEPPIDLPTPPAEQGAISDEALMRAIAQGNTAALSTLYDRYASLLKALTMRVVHDDTEADDLLQEFQSFRLIEDFAPCVLCGHELQTHQIQ